jgi:hypothetical protein
VDLAILPILNWSQDRLRVFHQRVDQSTGQGML